MTYTVTWHLDAVALLNQLSSESDDPSRIRKAAEWVDYSLRRHPLDLGESRQWIGERLWYEDVLGVYYEVDRDTMRVKVLSIGPARRR